MDTKSIFKYLAGSWAIKKTISNIGAGRGVAHFSLISNNTLQYQEEAKFLAHKSSINGRATHSYYIEDDVLYMQFMGQPRSYKLDICGNSACGIYNCGQDIYKTTLNFLGANDFLLTCIISGAKNCNITTGFARQS